MSDVRTLLSAAAEDGAPRAADPVAAVRTRVRRRAARRRAAVATGTTFAVAAGGTVLATGRGDGRDRLATEPTATATAQTSTSARTGGRLVITQSWQHEPGVLPRDPEYAEDLARLKAFVVARPAAFVAMAEEGAATEPGWQITLSLEPGETEEFWRPFVAEHAGRVPFQFMTCAYESQRYDEIGTDALIHTDWPSGAKVVGMPRFSGVTYNGVCRVEVVLDDDDPRDVAYAAARWGRDVRVTGPKPTPTSTSTATNPDGTRG